MRRGGCSGRSGRSGRHPPGQVLRTCTRTLAGHPKQGDTIRLLLASHRRRPVCGPGTLILSSQKAAPLSHPFPASHLDASLSLSLQTLSPRLLPADSHDAVFRPPRCTCRSYSLVPESSSWCSVCCLLLLAASTIPLLDGASPPNSKTTAPFPRPRRHTAADDEHDAQLPRLLLPDSSQRGHRTAPPAAAPSRLEPTRTQATPIQRERRLDQRCSTTSRPGPSFHARACLRSPRPESSSLEHLRTHRPFFSAATSPILASHSRAVAQTREQRPWPPTCSTWLRPAR